MAEYIERKAIRNRLDRIVEVNNLREDKAWFTPNGVAALIDEIPATDVRENKYGKWESVEVFYVTEHPDNTPEAIASMFCPNCKRYHNEVFFYGNPIENVNFCPRCGADMRGG